MPITTSVPWEGMGPNPPTWNARWLRVARGMHTPPAMALKTWLWNLGAAGTAVAAAGCGPAVAVVGDTEGSETEGTDTVIAPTGEDTDTPTTNPNETSYDTYDSNDSYYDTSYNDTEYSDSYYDTDYYSDTDNYGVDCYDDDDCRLGVCVDPGDPWSYCEALPIPPPCGEDVVLELAWVRQGEGAGTAAGVAGHGDEAPRVLLLGAGVDGGTIPVALSPVEADAAAQALPVALTETEQVIGLEQADLDGDADLDLLVSVRDDASMRVVPLLAQADGSFEPSADVVFEEAGGPAKLQRFADGSSQILTRLDSGLLFEASSLGDGTFAAPAPSAWASEPISDFAVGLLDIGASDDVLAATLIPEDGQSSLDALIDGGALPVGMVGSAARGVFVDAWTGHLITVDTSLDDFTYVQTAMLGVNASPSDVLVQQDAAPLASVVTDVDGDDSSDLVLLGQDGQASVVFQVSRTEACTQAIETKSVFDVVLAAGSGAEAGVVLSGADGVLSVRGG